MKIARVALEGFWKFSEILQSEPNDHEPTLDNPAWRLLVCAAYVLQQRLCHKFLTYYSYLLLYFLL